MTDVPSEVKRIVLYAWVGEDDYGSGEVGLKQWLVPAGMIPLVAVGQAKIDADYLREAMQRQANAFGKTIHLCRFVFDAEIIRIEPKAEG